jgi:hypothetical protein
LKIGNENRAKLGLMLGLLIIASVSVWRWMSGSAESPAASNGAVSAVTAPAKKETRNRVLVKGRGPAKRSVIASLDPTLRFDLLKSSEDRSYSGGNRNIFQAHQDVIQIPKPIDPGLTTKKIDTGPPPPPPPPPINLKFYGFANKPGETKQIFLSSGDDVFVAREGEIVNRRYRVVHIGSNSVDIEDVLNNNRQTIPLTQG